MDGNGGEGADLGEKERARDVKAHAASMDEDVRVKKDVAVGGDLLEMRVHAEEKESLFSIVGDPASLMNLQKKSSPLADLFSS